MYADFPGIIEDLWPEREAFRWIMAGVYADRLSIHHKMENQKYAAQAVGDGLKHLSRYEDYVTQRSSSSEKDRFRREDDLSWSNEQLGSIKRHRLK